MKYQNAQMILPKELLLHIQQYVQGSYLYIPIRQGHKKPWGDRTQTKQVIQERNEQIARDRRCGVSVKELAQRYYLTEHSIRRIIREQG